MNQPKPPIRIQAAVSENDKHQKERMRKFLEALDAHQIAAMRSTTSLSEFGKTRQALVDAFIAP